MKPKVAACLILKASDEEIDYFERCVASIKGHVDGLFVTLNSTKKVSKKHHDRVEAIVSDITSNYAIDDYKWEGNFVKTRNDNFALVSKDFTHIIWLDSDDTVDNPEKIREVAAIMPKGVDGVYINYDYAQDEYGNTTVAHYVARLVRNNNSFTWKSSFADKGITVHETLNPVRDTGKVMNEEFTIVHHATETRRDESLKRNITLLEGMLQESKSNPDPRILYYLATHYVDAGLLSRAKELFEHYLTLSGWAEERAEAWTYLGEIYLAMKDSASARGCFMRAVAENPKSPMPYVNLGELEMADSLYDKAIEWLLMATEKKADRTATISRPLESTYRAYRDLAECYTHLGPKSYEKALEWLKKAQKIRPFEPDMQKYEDLLHELMEVKELTEATVTLLNKLKGDKETERIMPFLNGLPSALQNSPLVTSARNYYQTPKTWDKNSIVIVCGWGPLGNWGPSNLNNGGLGGSEEAVIRISRELSKLGYKVTVFGTPGEEAGEHDGVDWRHYWEFNRKDTFDILINWRNPDFFETPVNARKSYLWLHDVIEKEEMTEERLKNVDRVIFISHYHRGLYPFVEDSKAFISGNGITPEDFEKFDGEFKRDPHRLIYMSSHVRGLEIIYHLWPQIKEAVPDASLDIYYGWESYVSVNRSNPERMAWKDKMLNYEKTLDGVTDHGRVGQDKINEEIFKSGVWAYPCPFPEVYCITAVKAQAGGAVPVSSSFAALDETVQFGTKIPMTQKDENVPIGSWEDEELGAFRDALIDMLKHPEKQEAQREKMMQWARTQSWENTAKGWIGDFNE